MRRPLLARVALPLVLSSASTAFAQSTTDAAAAEREARARFEEGLALHDANRDEEARLKFAQAWAAMHTPNILFNLARSEELSGHLLDAIAHWREYDGEPNLSASDHDAAKQHVAALARVLGHVSVDAPEGARIRVDGKPTAAPAPLREPVDVMPGRHVVEATFGATTRSVEVSPNGGETVTARFSRDDAAPAGAPPAEGASSQTTTTTKEPRAHAVEPPPADGSGAFWTSRNTAVVTLGGAAVVLAGVGVVFSVVAAHDASKADDAKAQVLAARPGADPRTVCAGAVATSSPQCQDWHDAAASNVRDKNFATGFYAGAGVAVLAAVGAWVAWPERARRAARVAPRIGAGHVGADLTLAF